MIVYFILYHFIVCIILLIGLIFALNFSFSIQIHTELFTSGCLPIPFLISNNGRFPESVRSHAVFALLMSLA